MALTLTIISYHQTSLEQATAKTLNQGRLTLGRAPDNDWVLPDPEMILSKSHCCIERRDDGYYITDTSTNGVFINHSEQRLGRGEVFATVESAGRSQIWETQFSGVWFVRHFGENDRIASECIEFGAAPEILFSHRADMSAAARRLAAALQSADGREKTDH